MLDQELKSAIRGGDQAWSWSQLRLIMEIDSNMLTQVVSTKTLEADIMAKKEKDTSWDTFKANLEVDCVTFRATAVQYTNLSTVARSKVNAAFEELHSIAWEKTLAFVRSRFPVAEPSRNSQTLNQFLSEIRASGTTAVVFWVNLPCLGSISKACVGRLRSLMVEQLHNDANNTVAYLIQTNRGGSTVRVSIGGLPELRVRQLIAVTRGSRPTKIAP